MKSGSFESSPWEKVSGLCKYIDIDIFKIALLEKLIQMMNTVCSVKLLKTKILGCNNKTFITKGLRKRKKKN